MEQSYQTAIQEIEKILDELESENIELDELVEKIERSSLLLSMCKQKLQDTEEQVNKLLPMA